MARQDALRSRQDAHAQAAQFTPNTLQQFYAVVPLHEKTNVLWSFLKSHKRDKIMIFFASQKQVLNNKDCSLIY